MHKATHCITVFLLAALMLLNGCEDNKSKESFVIVPENCILQPGKAIPVSVDAVDGFSVPKDAQITYQWSASSGNFNKDNAPTLTYTPEITMTSQEVFLRVDIRVGDQAYAPKRSCTFGNPTAAGGPTAGPSPAPASTAAPAPTSEPAGGQAIQAGVDPTPTPTLEPTVAPMPEPTTAPTTVPTAPAVPTATEPSRTVKIAVQGPLSGDWQSQGNGVRNAVALAIREYTQPMKSVEGTLEMVVIDDQADPVVGTTKALEAMQDPDIVCVIGPYNSPVTLAVYPNVYAAENIALISSSTNPDVTDKSESIWRLLGRDDVLATIAATFAHEELAARSVYIIHDNSNYGAPAAGFFRDSFQQLQGDVLGFRGYIDRKNESVDFNPFINDIKAKSPDLIYFTGTGPKAGEFIKQARIAGITAKLFGPDGLDSRDLLASGGAYAVGTHFVTVAAPFKRFPLAQEFADRYRNAYDIEASSFTAENYDAARLCIDAISLAWRKKGSKPNRQEVLEAMRITTAQPISGISGNYRFNSNGDPLQAKYYIFEVKSEQWSENILRKEVQQGPPQP